MRPMKLLLNALIAFVLVSPVAIAAEQTRPYVGPWPGWHSHWSGFWWICPLMMLFMLAIFAVVFFVLRRNRGDGRPPWRWMSEQPETPEARGSYGGVTPESALDILDKRYARGEIDKAEYDDKKASIISSDG